MPRRPAWDDDTEWEASLEAKPSVKPKPKLPLEDVGDFILSLAVRRKMTGYALLRFGDFLPLQFGLVDVSKHGQDEAQKKALEVAAVLRDLKQVAPKKLLQLAENPEAMDALGEEMKSRQWKWVIAFDDSTMDRGPPVNVRENRAQRTVSMLQGLLISDCKKIFKSAPQLVNPRRSRQLLGVRGGPSPQVRKEVFELATSQVPDFPEVRYRTGTLSEDTYLMSDAWAAARLAQRLALLAKKREDHELLEKLRAEAMASKQIQKLTEVVSDLHPRRESKELSDVLEKKVDQMVEEKLNRLLDEDLRRAKIAAAKAEARQSESRDAEL
ncbi:unnamed protein product [Effrenium voratum]|nr:unnamed protein product [Effrenium voratum]